MKTKALHIAILKDSVNRLEDEIQDLINRTQSEPENQRKYIRKIQFLKNLINDEIKHVSRLTGLTFDELNEEIG